MRRFGIILLSGTLVFPALAQTSGSAAATAAPENTGEQTPGVWVQNAITRHNAYIGARVNAARAGVRPGVPVEEAAVGGSSGTSGLGSLIDLLGNLGGLTGGDLTPLLEGLGAGGLAGVADAVNSDEVDSSGVDITAGTDFGLSDTDTSTDTSDTTGAAGQSLEDLIRQRATEGGATDTTQRKNSTMQSSTGTRTGGAAVNRLPKPEERYQTSTTTDDRPFATRFADEMMSTFFSAVALGIQTPAFVNLLEDLFRPLFGLPTSTETNTNSNSNSNANDNSSSSNDNANDNDGSSGNSNSNANESSNGGGVENLPDNTNTNSDSGGTV